MYKKQLHFGKLLGHLKLLLKTSLAVWRQKNVWFAVHKIHQTSHLPLSHMSLLGYDVTLKLDPF